MKTLRPYQPAMIQHMVDVLRGNLWAGMGVGKTVTTATAIENIALIDGDAYPAIVFAPKRVALTTWPDEYASWDHLKHVRVSPILGTAAERRAALRRRADVYTINYDNLPWLREELGQGKWCWPTVIADESTRLKSHRLTQGGVRTRTIAETAHRKVKRWINLTGTPSPNGLQDLWGQAWFLDAGQRLGRTYEGFMERWFRPSPDGHGVVPFDFAEEQIKAALRDITLSLESKDLFDLPELISSTVYVDLGPALMKKYKKLETELFVQLETGDVEAFNAAAKSGKCLQFAAGAVYLTDEDGRSTGQWEEVHEAKIDALEDIVEEAAGAPLLVAYHWQTDLVRLRRRFPWARVLDANRQTIADWNAGKIRMLFAHPDSAGHGLNLQHGGHHIVFFSRWWAAESYLQIMERIGPTRQAQSGYDRPVYVRYIVARGTLDEDVAARVDSKVAVNDALMAAMKRRRTE